MNVYGRLVVLLFAAILSIAQQEAATHALTHVADVLGPSSGLGDDGAHHECPDCTRFGSLSVGSPPAHQGIALVADEQPVLPPREALARSTHSPGPPRNRGPPHF